MTTRPYCRLLFVVVAVLGLGVSRTAWAANFSAAQSGKWSSTNTWNSTTIPGTNDNVGISRQNTTVTADVSQIGEILILERNTIVEMETNLNMSMAMRIGGGGYASGPGLVRTHGYDITTTYFSFGDWGYGLLEAEPGTVLTAAYITDQNQGSSITMTHIAGQDGLTFIIPNPDIGSNFRIKLNFDASSGVYDWAFRWQGAHRSEITNWLASGRMTYTNVPAVDVVEKPDGYTYVYATPEISWFNPGSTNVSSAAATAYATLEANGESDAMVKLYWATNNLAKTATGWLGTNDLGTMPTGLVSGVASGLRGRTPYYCRFYATNSVALIQGWSDTICFTTPPPPAGTMMTVK